MLRNKTIAFLGAGSMAEAMISGIVETKILPSKRIVVTNRSNDDRLRYLEEKYGVNGINSKNINFENIEIIVLAMKPKDAETTLQSIKDSLNPNQLILSVLAGVTTSFIEENLYAGQQIVRVMPNTSSMIGESATAVSKGKHTSDENVQLSIELLNSIGEVYLIPEEQMDVFTGIAGSGPAYFYYLMEHMEFVAQKNGLQPEISRQIIAQTILGAARMVQEQEEGPTTLREKVTSPNGTTAAGLAALDTFGAGIAISQAIKHASERSKEISLQLQKAKSGTGVIG